MESHWQRTITPASRAGQAVIMEALRAAQIARRRTFSRVPAIRAVAVLDILAVASAASTTASAARGTKGVVAVVTRRHYAHIAALLPDLRCLLAIVSEPDDIVSGREVVGNLDLVDDVPWQHVETFCTL
jgi:hypothetical protein